MCVVGVGGLLIEGLSTVLFWQKMNKAGLEYVNNIDHNTMKWISVMDRI